MQNRRPIRNHRPAEDGFMLLVAMFMLALLVLSLSIAVPTITRQIQRDREVETMHRGKQYIRAVQLYYRKFGSYPPNVNALINTNNIRFLRKKYTDPMTGLDDWKPIALGQNKAPMALGFFGQPLLGSATSIAGVGLSGGTGTNGAAGFGGSSISSSFGGATIGGSGTGGSAIGGLSSNSPGLGSSTGTSSLFGASGSTGTGTGSGTDATGAATSATGTGSTTGTGTSTGTSALGGQTFGGAGVIGFSPIGAKQSILLYKTKDHYNEWEFVYSPLSELKTIGGGGAAGVPGQPAGASQNGTSGFGGSTFGGATSGATGTGGTTSGSGFGGTTFGGTTFGGTGTNSGSSTSPTPTPQQPQ